MIDLLSYMMVYGLYAATLGLLFVLLFIHEPRTRLMRISVALLGVAAFALPAFLVMQSLGYPDPWPGRGSYRLLGWKVAESDEAIYLFVDKGADEPPQQLRVPFARDPALALQQARENMGTFRKMAVTVTEGPSRAEPNYVFDFEKVFPDD